MSVPFVHYHSIPRVDDALFTIAHARMKRVLCSIILSFRVGDFLMSDSPRCVCCRSIDRAFEPKICYIFINLSFSSRDLFPFALNTLGSTPC
jgi:hypothetical protein